MQTPISSNLQMSNTRLPDFNMGEKMFGVLAIKVANKPMSSTLRVLDSVTDNSGSMGDICADGKSKMDHAKHVLKNVINTVALLFATVSIASYSFDDKTDEIFSDTTISSENANDVCVKLNKIQPRNGTNLHQTLVCLKQRIESRDPGFKQTAIILTDGLINAGITDYGAIRSQLSDKCNNIFIGLGGDHDDKLLQQLASEQLGNNYFYIQEIEKAGFAFGEILHELLYTAISNVTIKVINGEIYNYATNKWGSELNVHALTSDAVKTYHLRCVSSDINEISVSIHGCIGDEEPSMIEDDITPIPDLMLNNDTIVINNLAIHVMRQKVLELLFDAHEYSMNNTANQNAVNTIRANISNLLARIKKYINDNDLKTDESYIMLCDDLTITLNTLHHAKAAMYSGSRRTSQGRQMAYNISHIDPSHLEAGCQQFTSNTQQLFSRYTSTGQAAIMRECSQDKPEISTINMFRT